MRRMLLIGQAAALVMVSSSIAAQTVGESASPQAASSTGRYVDPTLGMSLGDAITLALRQAPAIRATRAEIEVAGGRRQQAALRSNPTVSVERRDEPGGTDNQTTFGVQLPLDLYRRSARVSVADRELEVARLDVAERERLLAADVRTRYGAALAAIRELAILEELLGAVTKQLELLTARVGEGATPPLERDLLHVEAHRLAAEQRMQTSRVATSLIELKQLVGLAPDTPLTLRETLDAVVARESSLPAPPPDDDVIRARPDVRGAEARVGTADSVLRQAAVEGRPDVSVFGTYMRMDSGFMQRGFAPDGSLERVRGVFHYVAGGAMVTVPLFNRNQGTVAAARAQVAGAQAAHEAALLQAQSEAAAAHLTDASARAVVDQYRDGIRPMARKNLDVVNETFSLGRATVFDVLNEQRRYLEIERGYTEALRSAFDARTKLQLAAGEVR